MNVQHQPSIVTRALVLTKYKRLLYYFLFYFLSLLRFGDQFSEDASMKQESPSLL